MRKLFYVVLIAIIMVFGLTFVYHNHELISINYYGERPWGFSWEAPLSLILVVTFVAGVVMGLLFSMLANLRLRGRLMVTNRKLNKLIPS